MYRDGKQILSTEIHNFVLNNAALGDKLAEVSGPAGARGAAAPAAHDVGEARGRGLATAQREPFGCPLLDGGGCVVHFGASAIFRFFAVRPALHCW